MNSPLLKENSDSFRYERKFKISELDRNHVETLIKFHPAIFSEIFQKRTVNNIYFDSLNMDCYYDNRCGTGKRMKVRIRWYGNLFGLIENPKLEFKIKDGYVGTKKRFSINSFRLDNNFSLNYIIDVCCSSNIPDIIREKLMLLKLKVMTHYSRKYFLSSDKKYRITIDWDLEYSTIDNVHNLFINKKKDHSTTVLELKYSSHNDDNANIITNHFPFRFSKNSKYEVGINNLFY